MSRLSLFLIFLRLGLTSFGGPIAHIAYFRREFVEKRRWFSDHSYGDIVSLCQFLPGPASSQVGMAIGLSQGGIIGALLAWLGFTLPSAIMMTLFGLGLSRFSNFFNSNWLHGLMLLAIAVVTQAIWQMGRSLCPDLKRKALAIISACIALWLKAPSVQVLIIILGSISGCLFLRTDQKLPHTGITVSLTKKAGAFLLGIFILLLFTLPFAASVFDNNIIIAFDKFFRAGSLVFGGGHVVLPLLESEVVASHWMTGDEFFAGYGMAQAVPGPLFTFASYLGAVSHSQPNGTLGSVVTTIGVFLPSFLLIIGTLPFWEKLRTFIPIQHAIRGANAAVVGILLAALIHPMWGHTILNARDFMIASIFLVLLFARIPAWLLIVISLPFF